MDRVVISTELPDVTDLKSRLLAVEKERDIAEAHLRDCRKRCERMRTMEGLPLDECAARQLHAEAERDAARKQLEAEKRISAIGRESFERQSEVIATLTTERDAAREVIQNLLDSAYPHPVEHPCMFKAWGEARKFLEGRSTAVVADTVGPLALAAERLLAELGVTEPGAGEDNHEMPVAGLMDELYEAWNNYMRAKHGPADAIFEPEGE